MILGLLIFFSVIAVYAVIIRPWLRKKPWMQWFFANPVVEWIEIHLWRKSETILVARGLQAVGAIGAAAGYLGGIDWSIVAPVVPEKWQPFLPMLPMFFNALGGIMEWLRRDTTKPLELVDVPQEVSQKVATKLENADAAMIEAVAEVKKEEAKAAVLPPTVEQKP